MVPFAARRVPSTWFFVQRGRHLNTQATIQARAYGNAKKKKKERKAKQALIRFLAKVK